MAKQQIGKTIWFVAARSGGHLIPTITLAQQHAKNYPQDDITLVCSTTNLDHLLTKKLKKVNILQCTLSSPPKNFYRMIRYSFTLLHECLRFLLIIRKKKPSKVIGSGGFLCVPVCSAAWLLKVPVELLEFNAVPGKANLLLARFAQKIWCSFTTAKDYFPANKTNFLAYPLRFQHNNHQRNTVKHSHKKTLMIMGGSQGSAFLNTFIQHALITLPSLHKSIKIIHQTGSDEHISALNAFYAEQSIEANVFSFCSSIEHYYKQTDYVIARAGAGALHEIVFFNLPALIIPLEATTTTHQLDNAYAMAQQYPQLFMVKRQQVIKDNPSLLFDFLHTFCKLSV